MKTIAINKEPVELYKILKFEGLAASGAESKACIENGEVRVNNKIEKRKRNKIVAGDIIEFDNEQFKIALEIE